MRIGIDIGHQETGDRGSTEYDGQSEITFTKPVGYALKAELETVYECEVFLIHDGSGVVPGADVATELHARGEIANGLNLDFLISLHHNAGPQAAKGAELYIWTDKRAPNGDLLWLNAVGNHKSPKSYRLAVTMQPIIRDCLAGLGIPWRGSPLQIMCADFAILRYPKLPCMLLETHYGTNPDEDAIMDKPASRLTLARGLAHALAVGLNLAEKPKPRDPNEVTVLVDSVEVGSCQAKLEDGHTRGNLRALAEAMGGAVGWDQAHKIMSVSTKRH